MDAEKITPIPVTAKSYREEAAHLRAAGHGIAAEMMDHAADCPLKEG